jgi:diacylglycerol kinase family enzyme
VPLGPLPLGGTSVLARAMGLPRDPVAAAAQVGAALAEGRERAIRLGTLNGRRFAFAGGVGIDAEVVRRVDARGRRRGRRPGDAYYALQAVRALGGGRYLRPRATLHTATEEVRVSSVIAANVHPWSYVGRLPLRAAPLADPEAGFDLLAPRRLARRDLPRLAVELLVTGARAHSGAGGVVYLHDLADAVIDCDEPLPAQVDGDDVGDVLAAHLGIDAEGARLLV